MPIANGGPTLSDKKSHSATNEPWKHPGQSSQDPSNQHPIDNAAEQEAHAKKSQWDKAAPKKSRNGLLAGALMGIESLTGCHSPSPGDVQKPPQAKAHIRE